ncbi:MAG: ABC transporter ATP-binding protein [Defluviitaleaceae bacterium]|nr:ABC transporter ATP-binding protein [Defluviitaleaceae bacterium]
MLSVQGIWKYYGSRVALRNVTLTLKRGEVVGLFGANGAGKSTLLKTVMGLLNLSNGWVTLDDSPIKGNTYGKIAFITEEGSFFPDMTPRDHGEFYAAMLPRFNAARYGKLLEFFALEPDKKARTLSKGQRAKLEIAVGMSRGADYILMDEPFLGKDLFTRRDFLKLMISIIQPHEAVLIATHQIEEIEMFITRAVVLHEGVVVGDILMDALGERGEGLVEFIKKACGYKEPNAADWLIGL